MVDILRTWQTVWHPNGRATRPVIVKSKSVLHFDVILLVG